MGEKEQVLESFKLLIIGYGFAMGGGFMAQAVLKPIGIIGHLVAYGTLVLSFLVLWGTYEEKKAVA